MSKSQTPDHPLDAFFNEIADLAEKYKIPAIVSAAWEDDVGYARCGCTMEVGAELIRCAAEGIKSELKKEVRNAKRH